MTLEITTEAQAEAARKAMDAYRNLRGLFPNGWSFVYAGDELEAALATYEAQKADIVLTPCEMARMRWLEFGEEECDKSEMSIMDRGFENRLHNKLEPAGRAYLAAQKPKLRWEVHSKNPAPHEGSFRGEFDDVRFAQRFIDALCGEFEIREVQ